MNSGLHRTVLMVLASGTSLFCSAQTHNLFYYLQQGQANSPLLKDYQNQIKRGSLDSGLIHAANRPQISANGQVMVAPTIQGYGYDVAVTNGGNYTAVIAASQPLFVKNKLAPRYREITLQNRSIENTARLSKLDLDKKITSHYITGYADYQQILSNEEIYHLLQQQQLILKKLVQGGIYKQADYLNFTVALQSQEITISQLNMQYKADIGILNYLCGINDTSSVVLNAPDIPLVNHTDKAASVFFRQFTIDSLKIVNNKILTAAKYKPSLTWFADAGLEASQPNVLHKSLGASFGINLSIPIYDGKRRGLEYQKNELSEATRNGYAHFYNKQYDQQKALLEQQLRESERLIEQIEAKLNTAQLLISLDKAQLNAGNVGITDYVLAINGYLNVKNNLNQEQINRLQIINELNYWNH